MKITDSATLDAVLRRVALADALIGPAYLALPPVGAWVELARSKAWFSGFHFQGTPGFELPFEPDHCLWAPDVVELPVLPQARKRGYYRRGVAKYARALARGEKLPPVSFVFDRGEWHLLDGNHRYEAHVIAKMATIPALFAVPRDALF